MRKMQDIEQWLRSQCLETTPAYLNGTAIPTGRQLVLPPYQMVYRVDADEMIICELSRLPQSHCLPPQLFCLWRVLRGVFRNHPSLKQLKMLVITDTLNPNLLSQRWRLLRLLMALGASFAPDSNEGWLILPATHLLRRKRGEVFLCSEPPQ